MDLNFVYISPNQAWAVNCQKNFWGQDDLYCIYKNYPFDGWYPYKVMENTLRPCLVWLRYNNFISEEEATTQFSILTNNKK